VWRYEILCGEDRMCGEEILCGDDRMRVRTHAVLVIDLYELLGNPTT
jgi:hypothetical protein